MNCKLFLSGLGATLLTATASGASAFYVNDALVNCPPQIPPQVDATNFVNNNLFSINFTNFTANPQLYVTDNTLNFTNVGMMVGNTGFRFDWFGKTNQNGVKGHVMAGNFVNSGSISCGSLANTNATVVFDGLYFYSGLSKYLVSATNVVLNSSTNVVGPNGLFGVTGRNVDLNRSLISMEGYDTSESSSIFAAYLYGSGMYDAYWGIGNNTMYPAFQFEIAPPETPFHLVATPTFPMFQVLSLPAAVSYVRESYAGTNRFVQAVFLSDTNAAVYNNVYFPFVGEIAVEWQAVHTNVGAVTPTTNYLYLLDTFGTGATNRVYTNYSLVTGYPSATPGNYTFYRGGPFNFGTPEVPASVAGIFNQTYVTNEYAAYGVVLEPTTQLPGSLPGQVITNLPGRIEIVAEDVLNLTRARIEGLNYLRLRSTNHFVGSSRAQVSSPYTDISLASTNGRLAITNLLSPYVPRLTGEVDLYSARWTNSDALYTSEYHVLFVDSRVSPVAPAVVQDLFLKSTNVAISDVMNVSRSCLIDAERITVTSNLPPAFPAVGEINLLSSQITWPGATPRLQYLTNAGKIFSLNAVFFGGSRTSPFYSSNYNEPYQAFVNSGTVSTEGGLIWANYFENSGTFDAGTGYGSLSLQSVEARLTNGSFTVPRGDITINSGTLIVTNHGLQAGRKLTLTVTNLLTDTGISNVNTWAVGRGFDVPVLPANGAELRGTTVFDTAATYAENTHLWAALDLGCAPSGFTNNAALGRLILDGGNDSQFTFTGAGVSNAIYVDYLEFRNYTTNRDVNGDFLGVQIDPNMKVYFSQAVMNGISVAEKLDGRNDGRFCWVSEYADGFYSSTNLVYPDGTTNTFNTALVASCNLDSDEDGLVNCSDPTPIRRPQDVGLTVAVAEGASPQALVTWQAQPFASYELVYKDSMAATNWQTLTNVVQGASRGPVTVADPLRQTSPRFYRVRVDVSKQ